jgi:2-polyprenyl-6-methoxyphenol hydroxylase-like FAD-dependent oxidoreductase
MEKVNEAARSVDVALEADVLVVGSGPGGLAAAVSLKRDEAFDRLNIGAVQKELARQGARFR